MGQILFKLLVILAFHYRMFNHLFMGKFKVVVLAMEIQKLMYKKSSVVALIIIAGILPVILWGLFLKQVPPPRADESIRNIPFIDQTLVVVTAFIVKPLYMLISLVLVWILRRTRSIELVALRWGLLAFFIGEAFCSINYLFFNDKSVISEFLHSYGMVVSFGFLFYALMEGLDIHLIHYSHPNKRCSFVVLCRECVKSQTVSCRVQQIFQLVLLVLVLIVFIPLLAEIHEISYYTTIYNTLYNYTRLKPHLLFEIRYSPSLALVMFITAFASMQITKNKQVDDMTRVSLSAGIGALGFGIFRLFFNSVFSKNLAWAASWEEITEFILMITITYLLWLFRKPLDIFAD